MSAILGFAYRAGKENAVRDAVVTRQIAIEIANAFKHRNIPDKAQWLISGLIADLLSEAERFEENVKTVPELKLEETLRAQKVLK